MVNDKVGDDYDYFDDDNNNIYTSIKNQTEELVIKTVDPEVFDSFDLGPQVYDGIPVLLDIIDAFGFGLVPLILFTCCCCCCCLPCVAVKKGYNLYLQKQAEQEEIDKAMNAMSQRVF